MPCTAKRPVLAQKKDLQSFCGKLSVVATVVPTLRPFIDMVWAALASSSRLPLELVHCRRFQVALWWLHALGVLLNGAQTPLL